MNFKENSEYKIEYFKENSNYEKIKYFKENSKYIKIKYFKNYSIYEKIEYFKNNYKYEKIEYFKENYEYIKKIKYLAEGKIEKIVYLYDNPENLIEVVGYREGIIKQIEYYNDKKRYIFGEDSKVEYITYLNNKKYCDYIEEYDGDKSYNIKELLLKELTPLSKNLNLPLVIIFEIPFT